MGEKLEKIASNFLLKTLHVILHSRIPSLHPLHPPPLIQKTDKWFNLVLGDRPSLLAHFNPNPRHTNLFFLDVLLVRHRHPVHTLIERWVVQYEAAEPSPHPSASASASYRKTYIKSILFVRSLYSHLRLLPAYRLFRNLTSSNQTYNFDIMYNLSSFCEPFSRADEEMMKHYAFVPVDAFPGRLSVSVTYRATLSDFDLHPVATLPPTIITDYVGSPTTDPLRSFPSSQKKPHACATATSFPLRGILSPSSPSERPHSWTSGFRRAAPIANPQLSASPPAYRTSPTSYNSLSPPHDIFVYRMQNFTPTYQSAACYDEYQISPPFSPSPSPPTPRHLSNCNPAQSNASLETTPVSIPLPVAGRVSRYLYPNFSDPSRHSLPPLSPRSTRHDHSSQSPSEIRSIKNSDPLKTGESSPGMVNHYSTSKMFKDSKDDSGRFSGLLSSSGSPRVSFSRSSSRLSLQDDLEDCDFSCPFDVDDVDPFDSYASQNLDGRKTEPTQNSLSYGRKSQNAAVGGLVRMLRTAPPLCQDSSGYSSHLLRTDLGEGFSTGSGFFMPRKAADALEELRSYKELKDLLLSRSGNKVVGTNDDTESVLHCNIVDSIVKTDVQMYSGTDPY